MPLRLLIAAILAGVLPQAGGLTAEERQLVAAIDASNDAALALLERAVNINSGTMNLAGVREVGNIFKTELDSLGFTTEWVDGTPFERAGHLVGEHRGTPDGGSAAAVDEEPLDCRISDRAGGARLVCRLRRVSALARICLISKRPV